MRLDLREEVWVTDDNEEGLGTADGHIEPLRAGQETKVTPDILREKLIGRAPGWGSNNRRMQIGRGPS